MNWYTRTAAALLATLMLCSSTIFAQNYPSKAIRIETGGTGSNGDFASRLLALNLAPVLGQQVVVENRTSGIILGDVVAKSPPDGYTLLITGSSFWLAPFLEQSVPWDPVRDFVPVALLSTSPNLIVVHPSMPIKTVKELIALAKARPGQLNYASGSTGSAPHLAAELFKSMAHVNIVRINYKGAGAALNDLIGGQVQLMFPNGGGAAPHVKSGRLRALAVTTTHPSPLFPGVPTVAASGLPGYQSEVLNGLFAPAKTPAPIVVRINQEVTRVIARPDIKEKFFNTGVETIGGSADDLAAAVRNELNVWGKLIKDLGIHNE